MMNDDVLGMYAFLLFSPMIMLNLLKRNVAGASRYILIPFILGILSEKINVQKGGIPRPPKRAYALGGGVPPGLGG